MRPPPRAWEASVKQQNAYDSYNSAAILTYYFIQKEGGTPLAGYLDAQRRGENEAAAESRHLLPGSSRESLAAALISLCGELGIGLESF